MDLVNTLQEVLVQTARGIGCLHQNLIVPLSFSLPVAEFRHLWLK